MRKLEQGRREMVSVCSENFLARVRERESSSVCVCAGAWAQVGMRKSVCWCACAKRRTRVLRVVSKLRKKEKFLNI